MEAALLNLNHTNPSQDEDWDPALAAVRTMSSQWSQDSSCFSLDLRGVSLSSLPTFICTNTLSYLGVEAGVHVLQVVAGLYPLQDLQQNPNDIPTAKQAADIVGFDALRITRL